MTGGWTRRGLLGLALLAVSLGPAFAGDSLYGRVTHVRQADLITLNYGAGAYEIRLAGVQVPRGTEPHAVEAQKFVSDLVLGKNARMRLVRRAPSGEMVCRLFTDDPVIGIKEVGVELLRAGLARRQGDYDEKYGELSKAESEARNAERGIWGVSK